MQVPKGGENQILSKTEENFKGTKTRMEEQCGGGLAKAIERKRGSQKVQSWAAPYTGVWLHRAQLERHTEERNYNYDRKEDREGSLVFQRPGGCCHSYTDVILSYLGFEIDLALIFFCTGQLLGAVSRSSQECQCQHNALLYQVHITNFGTVIMWLQFELLYCLSIGFIPVVVGSFSGWLNLS